MSEGESGDTGGDLYDSSVLEKQTHSVCESGEPEEKSFHWDMKERDVLEVYYYTEK